ncbi:unnamed protein product [Adineta steineri]|uniref:FG-GAP repeat protein n=1 Tax=Adineta steineri TaxID=433720 RepID=A0A814KR75_9BILA|nr:unnamed protein product [Adineta steineri]CAF1055886.1 unnamed protein product [Adineta steineri]CAF1127224.1 unnamed protein product [Adineta steineri]
MTSMDIEMFTLEHRNDEISSDINSRRTSNPIQNQQSVETIVEDLNETVTVPSNESEHFLHKPNSKKMVFMFVLFTCISMIIGILIVNFSSPKPLGKTCAFILKSEAPSLIVSDSHPHSIAVADFNNDHLPDIVVPNSGTSTLGIFLRQDNTTFRDQITYSTGSNSLPYAVCVGDFNYDQQIDIAVANYGANNIGIFLAKGNGTFMTQITFSTGSSRPLWIAVGDMNNDKQLDIVIANYGTNDIGILFGDGTGNFGKQNTFSTGYDSVPYSLVVSDLNNDGNLDIIVANHGTDNVGIFVGQGNGTFEAQVIISTGYKSQPYSVAVDDLNNDTYMDIVVACSGFNTIGVLLGFGNGSFTIPYKYSTNNNSLPLSLVIGDFDNDTQLDIAVANYDNKSVGIFFGYGNGYFTDQMTFFSVTYNFNPYSIAAGDFNGDNRLDIAVVNYDYNYVDIVLTYRNYTFLNQNTYSTGNQSGPNSVAFADFNNDKQLDIVVANSGTNNIGIFLGYGNGTFSSQTTYSTGDNSQPFSVTIGDFNNDQQLDIVVANSGTNNIGIFFGYFNGTFSSQTTYSTGNGSMPYDVATGDFNNDGQLDIAVANYYGCNIGIFLGYSNGTFSSQQTYPTGNSSGPQSIAIGDFNNDSRLDIAVTNYKGYNVGVFLGYGNGAFADQISYFVPLGTTPSDIAIGDVNNDNHRDIIITVDYSYNILIFLGYGNGTFVQGNTYSTGSGSHPFSITVGDLNNDNQLDIVVSNCVTNNVVVFIGEGDGTFSNQRTYSTGNNSCPTWVVLSDINNDNILDIVVADKGTNMIGIFLGSTYMNGILEDTYSTGSSPHPHGLALGDFNHDGQLDIAIANYGLNNVGVLLGHTNGTFPLQTVFSTGDLSFPTSVAVVDLNNDNELDIIVANSATENVGILYGYGNGSFTNLNMYSTGVGSIPQAVTIGDFNNDKKLDIAIVDSGTNRVLTLLKYDTGSFRFQSTFSTGTDSAPSAVAVADLNNDGWLDFVSANSDNVGIFLGLSNDIFSNQTTYSTGIKSLTIAVTIADLNNDSYLDIVVSNLHTDNVGIFLGYGNGTFTNQTTFDTGYHSGPIAVVVADFNNDSRLDIAVALQFSGGMGVFLGHGNGTFSSVVIYLIDSNAGSSSIATGDLNNDNRLDIVVSNYLRGSISISYGDGDGNFFNLTSYTTGSGSGPSMIVVRDLNNDAILDIAVANFGTDNIGVFFGNMNHSFHDQITFSTGHGSAPNALVVEDFNDDNQLDIAFVNFGTNYLGVLLGCINGTFFDPLTYSTGENSQPIFLAVGDFNNDKRLDIVVSNFGTDNIGMFFGYVNEGFLNAPAYSTGSYSQVTSIAVGDFNNDTRLDVIITNNATSNVKVIFGSGYGTFLYDITYSTGNDSQPCSVSVADLNNDNRLDFVIANSGINTISIFLSNGTGTFSNQITYSTGVDSQPYSVVILDFNNDTRLDIAVASYGTSYIGVYFGYGNGSFMNQQIFSSGFNSHPFALAVGDIDNNNLTDIIATNNGYGNTDILMKTC